MVMIEVPESLLVMTMDQTAVFRQVWVNYAKPVLHPQAFKSNVHPSHSVQQLPEIFAKSEGYRDSFLCK